MDFGIADFNVSKPPFRCGAHLRSQAC
jgi:hypothetical protein